MTTTPPTRASAGARISAGLTSRPREHHGKRLAAAYRPDPEADRLLALRADRPEAWAALPVPSRTSLAYYAAAKAAADALGSTS